MLSNVHVIFKEFLSNIKEFFVIFKVYAYLFFVIFRRILCQSRNFLPKSKEFHIIFKEFPAKCQRTRRQFQVICVKCQRNPCHFQDICAKCRRTLLKEIYCHISKNSVSIPRNFLSKTKEFNIIFKEFPRKSQRTTNHFQGIFLPNLKEFSAIFNEFFLGLQ